MMLVSSDPEQQDKTQTEGVLTTILTLTAIGPDTSTGCCCFASSLSFFFVFSL